ncbi:DUF6913 domain-containing protein [Polaribacter glomeratus]|uniref:Uncharacterized protein n=1 Tax=Polaribacter glomeratus TaxID=102 RepID=A0A2S7WVN7_9FLAO|nr:hypothetical protein [Polaribacter glomeratus]PQJ81362.1 hypothetical protein BTO16_01655 [Polaribacter glomeratus]
MIPFKKYFLRKQFQKKLVENEVHRTVSQKVIKTVGIITTDEISNWVNVKEEVEKILNLRNVKIYSFRTHQNYHNISFKHFSEKDFNWQGNIFKPSFKSFIDEPFDLLIGYFNKNNLYLESAVLESNALFKVGISDVNQELYDIEIAETPIKTERFFFELKKYLTILRKLKN